MSKFKSQGMMKTFKNARKGFRLVAKSEFNIRIHAVVAIAVMFLGLIFGFDGVEFCILIFAIALVITTEMLNTALEFALDAIFHNKYSRMVGMAKDISAGAVLLATFASVAIGIILFASVIFD